MIQLSHLYMTTVKTKALTRWIFVGKVMSLLFNMLSTLVIGFLLRFSPCLLISWLAVTICSDFGAQENKSVTVSIVLSNPVKMVLIHLLHKDWGQGGLILWSEPKVKWGWWWLCLGPSGSSEFPKGHPEDSLVEWQGKNKKLETTLPWTF